MLLAQKNEYKTEDTPFLVKLYYRGRLGAFPESVNRLRVGLMLMKDYHYSIFKERITSSYSPTGICRGGAAGYSDALVSRQDAAVRYLKALKAVGKYRIYALHFLRDDMNVRSFILQYPILNKGCKQTYGAVYEALCRMLDMLVDFYDSQR